MGDGLSEEVLNLRLGHKRILSCLEATLQEKGFEVTTNEDYSIKIGERRISGEIDIYAVKEKEKLAIAFEVKGQLTDETIKKLILQENGKLVGESAEELLDPNLIKARYQLKKDLHYLRTIYGSDFNIVLMYAYGKVKAKRGYVSIRCKQNEIKNTSFP
jgi:hypothetical protein